MRVLRRPNRCWRPLLTLSPWPNVHAGAGCPNRLRPIRTRGVHALKDDRKRRRYIVGKGGRHRDIAQRFAFGLCGERLQFGANTTVTGDRRDESFRSTFNRTSQRCLYGEVNGREPQQHFFRPASIFVHKPGLELLP